MKRPAINKIKIDVYNPPWLGKRGDPEGLIIESWKLIVQRFNTQVRYKI